MVEAAGGSATLAMADVSEAHEVTAAHRAVAEAIGDVEILINNAGTNTARRAWRELSAADMGQIVDVNLKGPFLCSLAVLPAMRERRDGMLIHIVSNAAVGIFSVSGPAYTAAKHGARAMSATINAEEGIHGIPLRVHQSGGGGDADPGQAAAAADGGGSGRSWCSPRTLRQRRCSRPGCRRGRAWRR